MATEKRYQIMSMVSNPDDFLSWPDREKIKFYEKAIEWHDYIAKLQRHGNVEKAWGTQKIPGMAFNVATKTSLIAMYNVTLDQYSELITEDPLWNYGVYHAPILKSIEGDYEDDVARYHRIRERLVKVGKKLAEPALDFLDADKIPQITAGGKLQVLVTLSNTEFYGNLPDEQKLALDERVLQMHQYHKILRERGVILNEWGCYQNWGFTQKMIAPGQSGRAIYQVNTYDEFDAFYLMDPLILYVSSRTIILLPFEASREKSKITLEAVKNQLRK